MKGLHDWMKTGGYSTENWEGSKLPRGTVHDELMRLMTVRPC